MVSLTREGVGEDQEEGVWQEDVAGVGVGVLAGVEPKGRGVFRSL